MIFLEPFGDNVQAAAGAEYAMKNFGKTAYLLSDNGIEYTTLLGQYFKDAFTTAGGTIVLEDVYDDKATDFSAQIAKLKALPAQPDFYYIAAMPYNVGTVVKQFRDAGLTGPIVGGDGYDAPDLVQVAGAASDNVFFTTHALMDPDGRHGRHQGVHQRLHRRVRPRSRERVRGARLRLRLPARRRRHARRRHGRRGAQDVPSRPRRASKASPVPSRSRRSSTCPRRA